MIELYTILSVPSLSEACKELSSRCEQVSKKDVIIIIISYMHFYRDVIIIIPVIKLHFCVTSSLLPSRIAFAIRHGVISDLFSLQCVFHLNIITIIIIAIIFLAVAAAAVELICSSFLFHHCSDLVICFFKPWFGVIILSFFILNMLQTSSINYKLDVMVVPFSFKLVMSPDYISSCQ